MSTDANQDLHQFHQFLTKLLASNPPLPSPEEAIEQWRDSHPASAEYQSAVSAIKESLAEISQGSRGMTLDEFNQDFRARHGLPSRS